MQNLAAAEGPARGLRHHRTANAVYPLALAAAFLVGEQLEEWVPVGGMVRVTLALGVATVVLQLVASRILGADRGAYLTALLVFGLVHLQLFAFLMGAAAVAIGLASFRARRAAAPDWPRLTRFLNVMAGIALAVALGTTLVTAAGVPSGSKVAVFGTAPAGSAPDIYLILLDGYPRADVLQEALRYDNAPFLERMQGLGFNLAEEAHSNYNRTTLTVASMLNARHIDELMPSPPSGQLAQQRHLSSLVNTASGPVEARRVGYSFVAIPSPIAYITPDTADQVLDSGNLSQFEYGLARNGGLAYLLRAELLAWYRHHHRERILTAFDTLEILSGERAQQPRLVLAHILLPHDPIVFRADGSWAAVPGCYWTDCDLEEPMDERVRSAFAEQVQYTNVRVEEMVRTIIARSEQPPVIALFGDHGFRHWLNDSPETFRSLFLSYTPGYPDLFPSDASPINLLPRILNSYAGSTLPISSDDVWVTVGNTNGYFPLTDWGQEPT